MNDDELLTTDDVIGYLHVNLRTVYRLVASGRLPAVRVGRQWRFRKRDLDEWLERHAAGNDDNHPPRVLVVDDEVAARELLAGALGGRGYDVETVPDGPTAVDRLNDGRYDLMITDLNMEGMNGLAVIREARRRSLTLPVIIVTGFSTEASAIDAIGLGVSGYLTKPFRKADVAAAAARALGRKPSPSR